MKESLVQIFKKYNIDIVYLFGSQKDKGYAYLIGEKVVPDENSDLDIGVHLKEMPQNMFEYYGSLYAELSSFF